MEAIPVPLVGRSRVLGERLGGRARTARAQPESDGNIFTTRDGNGGGSAGSGLLRGATGAARDADISRTDAVCVIT